MAETTSETTSELVATAIDRADHLESVVGSNEGSDTYRLLVARIEALEAEVKRLSGTENMLGEAAFGLEAERDAAKIAYDELAKASALVADENARLRDLVQVLRQNGGRVPGAMERLQRLGQEMDQLDMNGETEGE